MNRIIKSFIHMSETSFFCNFIARDLPEIVLFALVAKHKQLFDKTQFALTRLLTRLCLVISPRSVLSDVLPMCPAFTCPVISFSLGCSSIDLVGMLVGFDYRVLVCGSMVLNHEAKTSSRNFQCTSELPDPTRELRGHRTLLRGTLRQ